MNPDRTIPTTTEVIRRFGPTNDVEGLNHWLGLPPQHEGHLNYNSSFTKLDIIHNIFLPPIITPRRSDDEQINRETLDQYSQVLTRPFVAQQLPYEVIMDVHNYTIILRTTELATNPQTDNNFWVIVQRTIFFHLSEAYASLDLVANEGVNEDYMGPTTRAPTDTPFWHSTPGSQSNCIMYDTIERTFVDVLITRRRIILG